MTVDEENVHADVYTVQYWSAGRIDHRWNTYVRRLIIDQLRTYACILADNRTGCLHVRTYVQLFLYGKHDGRMCLLACNKQLCIS